MKNKKKLKTSKQWKIKYTITTSAKVNNGYIRFCTNSICTKCRCKLKYISSTELITLLEKFWQPFNTSFILYTSLHKYPTL